MKKLLLVWGLIVAGSVFLFAEDIDDRIRTAVIGLGYTRLTSPMDVSIGEIYLEGTQTVSGLSRYLYNRINAYVTENDRLRPVAPSRGISRPVAGGSQKGVIRGTFIQRGDRVNVTLQLVGEPGGQIIDTKNLAFTVAELSGIEILPANIKTQEEAKEQEVIFTPPPAPAPRPNTTAASSALEVKAWPNSDTNTFFHGDNLRINLESNQDCYFIVCHIDVEKKFQIIYPLDSRDNNFLRANTARTIPDYSIFDIIPPYGQDTIIVYASPQPFTISAELLREQNATRNLIETIPRGLAVRNAPDSQPPVIINTRFNYTSLPASYYDMSYSYRKPANMTEALQNIQAEVRQLGGSFNGNEREGTFSVSGITGNYRISGDTVTVSLRFTGNQFTAPVTRGAGFNFSIDLPRNISQAVQMVRTGIENKGGTFSGNEKQGTFRASGITGQYNVADRVNVVISEKPAFIPKSVIEREVRNYFSGR